jgi:hypothetical protein
MCSNPICSRTAVEELLGHRNETCGFYCKAHARQALKKREALEERLFEQQRKASAAGWDEEA